MKSRITMLLAFLFLTAYSASAQTQQRQRMSVEDRVKATMERLSPLKLDADQQKETEKVFTDYFNNQQKTMQEMREKGERPDRSVFQKGLEERDAQLQKIFTKDQLKQFKEQEAKSRQGRGQGQGQGQRQWGNRNSQ